MQLKRYFLLYMPLILLGCGNRPETKDYFMKVTGARLCESAKISNITDSGESKNPGFDSVYHVKVFMNNKCIKEFVNHAWSDTKHDCSSIEGCEFILPENKGRMFITVMKGGVEVVHST